ncbi:MAG: hypothetical protein PVG63_07030 [Anaerolineales bacterium]|jgi:hypothetical protein
MKVSRAASMLIALAAIAGILAQPSTGVAQTNIVTILYPSEGEALQGVVTIEGSANHPDFSYYALSFTYADLSSPTWFPLSEPSRTPVTSGALGLWDTTSITDGNYILRLQVFLLDGSTLEAVVENVRIRNTSPIETNTPAPVIETLTPSPIPPTATSFPTPINLTPGNGQTSVMLNLCLGAFGAILVFSALAVYIQTSRATRLSLGSLRMRWLHWRESRRQKGKKL